MRKACLFLLFISIMFSFGCGEKPEKPEEVKPFVPPYDGKIRAEQKDAYIKASTALKEAMDKYSLKIKDFVVKQKVNPDLSQMSDTAFMNSHPVIKKAWDGLNEEWNVMQNEAYKVAGITEEEFNWIGGALTDDINKAVQKQVEKALTSGTETKTEEEKGE